MTANFVMVVGAACLALLTLHPKLVNAPLWRATVTPLASIIGLRERGKSTVLRSVKG